MKIDEGKEGTVKKTEEEMPETADEKETWHWLRKADLKVETEAMCFAQEQAI